VNVETIILAVANALRPTSLAAVYALLGTSAPRRFLTAFLVAGFAFSTTVGLIVVTIIHGADLRHGSSTFDAIVNLLAGVAALGFAAGLAQGRMQRSPRAEADRGESALARRLRDPSLGIAAGAGVATHLPGLLYLVGLNQISAEAPPLPRAIVDVTIFNAIWWSIPAASLGLFLLRPEAARGRLAAIEAWARSHNRQILVVLFAAVGGYLTVRGAVNLFG
jgi:hypothetical protein